MLERYSGVGRTVGACGDNWRERTIDNLLTDVEDVRLADDDFRTISEDAFRSQVAHSGS